MKFALSFLLAVFSLPAQAQIHTCPDGRGGKVYQQAPCAGSSSNSSSGYVRCIKPNGDSYIYAGTSCPARREQMQHQPGMVTDVTTGQQHFMVPGGGNGMIDPKTGQRHELISPPPTRRVQDAAQPISRTDACGQARMERDSVLKDPNRTMNRIRSAEARYDRLCAGS